jgi:thiosulfate reductase cytochrome b subunit
MTTVPLPVTAPDERLVVAKHHALVRISHWLNFALLIGFVLSGLAIYWASPVFAHAPSPHTHSTDYVADLGDFIGRHLPGHVAGPNDAGWVYEHLSIGRFALADALQLHWLFAYLFTLNGFIYLVGLILGRGYRALLPRFSDVAESLAMIRYYLGVIPMKLLRRPWPHPVIRSKYNALQRGGYATMGICGALALASGWAMHKPVQLWLLERGLGSYDGARIIHFLMMLVFMAFLIPHVVLVAADGWDTFRSMITGWSTRVGENHDH